MDWNGCPMKADDWVLLSFPSANRDPERVRPGRRGRHRPRGQPPRRVRPRHPPLRRARTWPAWSCGSPSRCGSSVPELRARRSRRRPLVRRPGPRPAHAPDPGHLGARLFDKLRERQEWKFFGVLPQGRPPARDRVVGAVAAAGRAARGLRRRHGRCSCARCRAMTPLGRPAGAGRRSPSSSCRC